ncbi:MAG: carboxypeptidase regulatory-like domain-containing protein [Planctomycetia bacterium]|nr:carboxypeptidase regulatory-like domain-containing protein [Planctomycetia bacterium]
MNHRIAALAALVLLAAVVSAGCKKGETLGTVTGNVTFQGKPVTEGMVMFVGPGVHMTAKLDAQGHYEVKQAKGAGLPPGSYQVSVNPPVIDAPMAGGPPVKIPTFPNIPLRYRDPKTSGQTLTVTEKGSTLDIDMKP